MATGTSTSTAAPSSTRETLLRLKLKDEPSGDSGRPLRDKVHPTPKDLPPDSHCDDQAQLMHQNKPHPCSPRPPLRRSDGDHHPQVAPSASGSSNLQMMVIAVSPSPLNHDRPRHAQLAHIRRTLQAQPLPFLLTGYVQSLINRFTLLNNSLSTIIPWVPIKVLTVSKASLSSL